MQIIICIYVALVVLLSFIVTYEYPRIQNYSIQVQHLDTSESLSDPKRYIRSCRNGNYTVECQNMSSSVYIFITNFHRPYYHNIAWLDNKFYSGICNYSKIDFDVVYMGTESDNVRHVINNHLPDGGEYSYHDISIFVTKMGERGDQYKGYFLINDDNYLNPHILANTSLETSFTETYTKNTNAKHCRKWRWWYVNNSLGITFGDAFKNAVYEINNSSELSQICGPWTWHPCDQIWSDFYYVTHQDLPKYLALERVVYKHRLFLENAVSKVMLCITNRTILSCGEYKCRLKRKEYLYLHPFKYSKPQFRKLAMHLMHDN